MTPLEIIQLVRLGVSAATSIGIDVARVRDMMSENEDGELTELQVSQLLAESQAAIDGL